MSRMYGPIHRSLQDRFDTRRLADNVEKRVVLTEIIPHPPHRVEPRRAGGRPGSLSEGDEQCQVDRNLHQHHQHQE